MGIHFEEILKEVLITQNFERWVNYNEIVLETKYLHRRVESLGQNEPSV